MSGKAGKIELPDIDLTKEQWQRDDKIWNTNNLIKASAKLKEYDLPISTIAMDGMPWDIDTIYDFLKHLKRIKEADLKHPILVDNYGFICNGWHRVVKAWMDGKATVKAKRFIEMPEPDDYDTKRKR